MFQFIPVVANGGRHWVPVEWFEKSADDFAKACEAMFGYTFSWELRRHLMHQHKLYHLMVENRREFEQIIWKETEGKYAFNTSSGIINNKWMTIDFAEIRRREHEQNPILLPDCKPMLSTQTMFSPLFPASVHKQSVSSRLPNLGDMVDAVGKTAVSAFRGALDEVFCGVLTKIVGGKH